MNEKKTEINAAVDNFFDIARSLGGREFNQRDLETKEKLKELMYRNVKGDPNALAEIIALTEHYAFMSQ
ncbi:hypothetical protein MOD13_04755 [Bacillus vallismortis]|uniref:hypothetical protein n=1 Tax=Bacillus vallismortis TaxID=72361 RepID=UPI00228120DB|nr:hypothetical protein [Bacillus vallismortis]MCY8532674.1 hypothetical protein [Bacillus vallismortis]